ncbi:hypothetical protein ACH4RG_22935 [Streptomyces sp. NPDC021019]|uniref:hypothetical protein n=1 Tax=Streptomyces sp. NPDC021019 TaxID=3365108 RepID=UPI0037A24885
MITAGTNVTVTGAGRPDNPYVIGSEGNATVQTACGLSGTGAAGTPLTVEVDPWTYPCDLGSNAGRVYCDSSGALRSEPRGRMYYTALFDNESNAATLVPDEQTLIVSRLLPLQGDPCRPAIALVNADIDIDFNLPASAGAAYAMGLAGGSDEMAKVWNGGPAQGNRVHVQTAKTGRVNIAAGAIENLDFDIFLQDGSGGARYTRVQWSVRAYVFIL